MEPLSHLFIRLLEVKALGVGHLNSTTISALLYPVGNFCFNWRPTRAHCSRRTACQSCASMLIAVGHRVCTQLFRLRNSSLRAHGVVVSHPLYMRKALCSNPSVSILAPAPDASWSTFGPMPHDKHNIAHACLFNRRPHRLVVTHTQPTTQTHTHTYTHTHTNTHTNTQTNTLTRE